MWKVWLSFICATVGLDPGRALLLPSLEDLRSPFPRGAVTPRYSCEGLMTAHAEGWMQEEMGLWWREGIQKNQGAEWREKEM